jgi:hypothetical protein
LLPSDTALDPTSVSGTAADGTPLVATATPLLTGISEISAFGNATRITIVDETTGDATYGDVIGGFNPSNVAGTNIAANWTSSTGTFSIPVNAGVFTSNGLKTVEVFATDDAGSAGNKVTLSFTLDVAGISPPTAPVTPTLQLITTTPGYTNNPTPELSGVTSPFATVELFELVGSTPQAFVPAVFTTADANGNFTFTFPDLTNGMNGTFSYSVVAQATNTVGSSGFSKPPTQFTIIVGTPAAPTGFSLAAGSDTGIVGDDVTSDRTPYFTGQTEANATVELFKTGSSTVYQTVTANGSGIFTIQLPFTLTNGSISLYVEAIDQAGNQSAPSNTLTVDIVSIASDYNADSYSDAALYSRTTVSFTGTLTSGSALLTNLSSLTGLVPGVTVSGTGIPSGTTISALNTTALTGTIANGSTLVTGISSATGLFVGETVTGTGIQAGTSIAAIGNSSITLSLSAVANGSQSLTATAITLSANATVSGTQTLSASPGVWLVEPTSVGPLNPAAFWFTSGTAFGPSNVIPFQGDFDSDGYTDLAYYQASSSTWYMYDSKSANMTSFTLSNTNATTVPVAGYFDANGPDEPAVYSSVSGQGVWQIVSAISGLRTVSFGQAGDIPVPGDYTGVGYDELAVYRPSTGQYLVQVPSAGGTFTTVTISIPGIGGGTPDVPVPGNYNPIHYNTPFTFSGTLTGGSAVVGISSTAGLYVGAAITGTGIPSGATIQLINATGLTITLSANATASGAQSLSASGWIENTEAAVFNPNTGVYTILGPSGVDTVDKFQPGDIPAPADYAGNGSTQAVVFRPSTGQFIEVGGTVIATFGQASADIPLAAPLSYRMPAATPADPASGTGSGGTTGSGSGSSTGSGTTGSGSGSTGSGSTGSGSSSTGSGTSSSGQTSSTSTPTPTPTPTPASTVSPAPAAAKGKKKAKKVVHPKKVVKPKKSEHRVATKRVKVVTHPAKKAIKLTTAHTDLSKKPKSVVDLALESIHVNLRRSAGKNA